MNCFLIMIYLTWTKVHCASMASKHFWAKLNSNESMLPMMMQTSFSRPSNSVCVCVCGPGMCKSVTDLNKKDKNEESDREKERKRDEYIPKIRIFNVQRQNTMYIIWTHKILLAQPKLFNLVITCKIPTYYPPVFAFFHWTIWICFG